MRKKQSLVILLVLFVFVFSFSIFVSADEFTGKEIMEKVYNRNTGQSRRANLEMILINNRGDERIRKLKQYQRDFGNVEKKIMFFISPQDVRGTSFMNWTYQDNRGDSQWIYLPALGKIKRISAENKSDNFMGSDFTYDDLGERNIDEDNHSLIKTEEVRGEDCYVVKNIPKEQDYMYSKTITWVSKDNLIGLKKEFYDQEGNLLKVLTVREYQVINGIVTITHSEMENVQKDHKTILKLDEVNYNTEIPENRFTERSMKIGI